MIRGPVLPLAREGLWQLVRAQPELIERGLRLVCEDLELGTGELGLVDGLLRDAAGNPVLLMITDDADKALIARVAGVHAFCKRNAGGLARAIPEARLRLDGACRLLVVTASMGQEASDLLRRLGIERLEVVEIERFHVGEQERLIVRTGRAGAATGAPPLDDAIDARSGDTLAAVTAMLRRLDPRIAVDGDRYSRRATHEGRLLCEYWFADELVRGVLPAEDQRVLSGTDDARAFVDRVARRYLSMAGERAPKSKPDDVPAAAGEPTPGRSGLETLRASMSLARLSREEWSALGDAVPEEDPRSSG
jgi:hypothetical protein